MATKGSSENIKTPEQQNQARRAAKQRRRHAGSKAVATTDGYLAGLVADRVNQRGVDMLDVLDVRMVSASPTATTSLRDCMLTYVTMFTGQTNAGYQVRHATAKQRALEPLVGKLRAYAERQLDGAFRSTRPVS